MAYAGFLVLVYHDENTVASQQDPMTKGPARGALVMARGLGKSFLHMVAKASLLAAQRQK
jgi:hypothetical protein